jgi:hypothetical protein
MPHRMLLIWAMLNVTLNQRLCHIEQFLFLHSMPTLNVGFIKIIRTYAYQLPTWNVVNPNTSINIECCKYQFLKILLFYFNIIYFFVDFAIFIFIHPHYLVQYCLTNNQRKEIGTGQRPKSFRRPTNQRRIANEKGEEMQMTTAK